MPGIRIGTGATKKCLEPICVIGAGRVGSALAARLRERGAAVRSRGGRDWDAEGAELVLLCVPDGAIAEVAQQIAPGPGSHT